VISDLKTLLLATRPSVVYTHNLADKHPTHVAVALRLLSACRALPKAARPVKVIGCEVWRDLDWLADPFKVVMALDGQESLQQALLGVFDSQVAGGKRYDLAAMGRRRANATYLESHGVDRHAGLIFGMDLTPLIRDNAPSPRALALKHIQDFAQDVQNRIDSLLGRP
jgi:LmbE family N-acetylglucosaminyl deacetylase